MKFKLLYIYFILFSISYSGLALHADHSVIFQMEGRPVESEPPGIADDMLASDERLLLDKAEIYRKRKNFVKEREFLSQIGEKYEIPTLLRKNIINSINRNDDDRVTRLLEYIEPNSKDYYFVNALYQKSLSNFAKALELTNRGILLARANLDVEEEFTLLDLRAEIHYIRILFDDLVRDADTLFALHDAHNLNRSLGKIKRYLGAYYFHKNDPNTAISYYLESIDENERYGMDHELCQSYIRIGSMYGQLAEYAEAEAYFQKANEKANINDDRGMIALSNYYLASLYRDQQKGFEIIEQTYRRAELGFQRLDNIEMTLLVILNRVFFYRLHGCGPEAKELLIKAKRLLDKTPEFTYGDILYHLENGMIHFEYGNPHLAIESCKKSLKKLKESGLMDKTLVMSHECMANSYESLNKMHQALIHQKKAHSVYKKMYNVQKTSNLLAESFKSKANNIQLKNKLLEEEILYESQKKKDRSMIFILMLASGLIIISLMYSKILQKRGLNSKLSMINNQLVNSNNMLQEANDSLSHFAYIAAHDLKSPLRTISSFIQLLIKKNENKFDEKDKEYCRFIEANADSLTNLVTDLLTFAKATYASSEEPESNINEIINDVVSKLQTEIAEANISIQTAKEFPLLNIKRSLLTRVYLNLLTNSIKFRNQSIKSKIEFDVHRKDNSIVFSVKDNGLGIEHENKFRVFDLFTRLNAKIDGTGIGLSTCKKIVHHHGGKMWIDSKYGHGTTVFFSLPKSLELHYKD